MPRKLLPLLTVLILILGTFGLRAGPIALADGPDPANPDNATTGVAAGFTYQGQLRSGGNLFTGACDMRFGLFSAFNGGAQLGATQTVAGVGVAGGLFTVLLNQAGQFGPTAFDGNARWLKIEVKCGADGGFTTLAPRQALTPAPYALSLPGMRVEPNAISPNVIGGHISNTVTSGVVGGTIGGGGQVTITLNDLSNHVTDDFGTVGGGGANRAGDGFGNTTSARYSTVAGGYANVASGVGATAGGGEGNESEGTDATITGGSGNAATGNSSTIAGGQDNRADNEGAAVAGGQGNVASGVFAAIGGGSENEAEGDYSAIPGGQYNDAIGVYSFAAGFHAHANHAGAFVWADSFDSSFTSTGQDQFLIRAAGGVGIGTQTPTNQLHVSEAITGNAVPANHVVQIENGGSGGSGPDLLALRASSVLTPNDTVNYITFFDADASSLGAIQGNGSGGVVMAGPGNDFAEYLPKQTASEVLSPGDIVGMHAGHLSRVTSGADQVLVISTSPIVAGNAPGTDAALDTLALAAFVGQAQVRVLGPVTAGSFIVPSGQSDGLGIAIAPEDLTAEQAAQIAGQALESVAGKGAHTIRIAVGMPRDQIMASLFARVQALEGRAAPAAAPADKPAQAPLGSLLPWLISAGLMLFSAGVLVGRRRSAPLDFPSPAP